MVEASLGLPDAFWRQQALIFNTQPARYLHHSWCERLPHGARLDRLRGSPRAQCALSHHLLTTFELEGHYVEDFTNHWARLALLDGPWIEHLLRRLGLALYAPSLRLELSGECLRGLKSALGADDWNFVTREASLLGQIPVFQAEPCPPDTDPATWFALIGAHFCRLQGLGALDMALTQRLALKLPAAWSSALSADHAENSSSLPPILRKLLRELPPAWIPLFA
jgi:hypothetical protein